MRLSVIETDPSYSPRASEAKVYLDGKLLDLCFTADEERGEAFCYVRDANGKLVIDRSKGVLVTERLTGTVRIELAEGRGA